MLSGNRCKKGGNLKRWIELFLALSGVCMACPVWADCLAGQELFTSCQIADRATEVAVCFDDQIATYRYGPIGGAPELTLSESIAQVDFVPWPGVGRSIYEYVTFFNGAFSYEVGGGFQRPVDNGEETEENTEKYGWLTIEKDGEAVSSLECRPETVTYGFGGGIYDAKRAAGLEWDSGSKTWVAAAKASQAGSSDQ